MKDYTIKSLVSEVQTRIGDAEYPEAEIKNYLNEAQFEVLGADKFPFLEKTKIYDNIGSGELTLPLDFQSIINFVMNGEELEYIAPNDYFRQHHSERERKYTCFSGRIYFQYTSQVVNHVRLMYLAKPAELDDDDEPYIPYEYKEILVLGALYRIERIRNNYDFAEVLRRTQDELILNMTNRYGMRQQSFLNRSKLPIRKMKSYIHG